MSPADFILIDSTEPFHIEEQSILNRLGVPLNKADEYVTGLIHGLISHCSTIWKPCAVYTVFDQLVFRDNGEKISVKDCELQVNKRIASGINHSEAIAVFIGTCGRQIETYSRQLIGKGYLLEGYIVDFIGSEIAELVAERVHKKIVEDSQAKNLKTTNRYSPGYCNWPVSDQQKLFHLMEGNSCGVQINDSSLMIPFKSISGIVGIGRTVQYLEYACNHCPSEHCLYRDKNK